ncbi:hypothetical protein BURK1_01920 [Burkholderiales bacterium]|nr:hypothetical protein BURK1_01920 [Burkholderiales bacterium]
MARGFRRATRRRTAARYVPLGRHRADARDEAVRLVHAVSQERGVEVESFVTLPRAATGTGVNGMQASVAFICGELRNGSMPRSRCRAIALPIAPGVVAMIDEGVHADELCAAAGSPGRWRS